MGSAVPFSPPYLAGDTAVAEIGSGNIGPDHATPLCRGSIVAGTGPSCPPPYYPGGQPVADTAIPFSPPMYPLDKPVASTGPPFAQAVYPRDNKVAVMAAPFSPPAWEMGSYPWGYFFFHESFVLRT